MTFDGLKASAIEKLNEIMADLKEAKDYQDIDFILRDLRELAETLDIDITGIVYEQNFGDTYVLQKETNKYE